MVWTCQKCFTYCFNGSSHCKECGTVAKCDGNNHRECGGKLIPNTKEVDNVWFTCAKCKTVQDNVKEHRPIPGKYPSTETITKTRCDYIVCGTCGLAWWPLGPCKCKHY